MKTNYTCWSSSCAAVAVHPRRLAPGRRRALGRKGPALARPGAHRRHPLRHAVQAAGKGLGHRAIPPARAARQRLPGPAAHEGRRPRRLLFRGVRRPGAAHPGRACRGQGKSHRHPRRHGRHVREIPGPVRAGPDARRRPAPGKAGQAGHLHRHGERLPAGPRPGLDRLFLQARRALRHPGPYRRQRHLRLLDRPQGPRGPGPERLGQAGGAAAERARASWSTSRMSPTAPFSTCWR